LEIFVILDRQCPILGKKGESVKKLLILAAFAVSMASAKDMTGRFGIGGDQTLGGVSGISLVFQPSRLFGIQLVTGYTMISPPGDGDAITLWGGAAGGFLNLADFGQANLHLGGMVNVRTDSRTDNALGLSLDLPTLRAIWFATDNFSIHTQVGVNIDILQPGNDPAVGDYESTLTISTPANLLGQAGFTFWF
jgi:hypothetical protein